VCRSNFLAQLSYDGFLLIVFRFFEKFHTIPLSFESVAFYNVFILNATVKKTF
jgi:hypothetical protein